MRRCCAGVSGSGGTKMGERTYGGGEDEDERGGSEEVAHIAACAVPGVEHLETFHEYDDICTCTKG